MRLSIKTIFLVVCAFAFCFSVQAQKSKKERKKELQTALLQFDAEENEPALAYFLAMEKEDTKLEPEYNYYVAQLYLRLAKYDLADEYIIRVLSSKWREDAKLYYYAGRIFQARNEFYEAEDFYNRFLANANAGAISETDVQTRLAQARYAKQNFNSKRNVTLSGISANINTENDEYAPAISSDGKMLVYTTKRQNSQGVAQEDIYVSYFDGNEWSVGKPLGSKINTDDNESVLSISPNGKDLFFYKYDKYGEGDIYTTTYNEKLKDWGEPSLLPEPINTSDYEGSASITADGKTMYFISDRQTGEIGGKNVFKAKRLGKDEWDEPEELSREVNSDKDEVFVYVTPDGKTLFVASDGRPGFGGFDIYRYDIPQGKNSKSSELFNIGAPINSGGDESTFCFYSDLKKMLVAVEKIGGKGQRDIYEMDLKDYPIATAKDGELITGTLNMTINNEEGGLLYNSTVEIYDINSALVERFECPSGRFSKQLFVGGVFTVKVQCEKFNSNEKVVRLAPSLSGEEVVVNQSIGLSRTARISTLDEQKGTEIKKP